MPLENATYLDTLVPDWPTGPSDPVSIGDDNLRMIKKVLQNTFPNINGPINATPEALNGITDHLYYSPGDGTPGNPAMLATSDGNPDDAKPLIVTCNTPDAKGLSALPYAAINWNVVMNILYPVGGEYSSYTDNRNPADILGFGVWSPVVGLIAGIGTAIDSQGYSQNYYAGYQAGCWRVQVAHIVAADLDLAMDQVQDHQHPTPDSFVNSDPNGNSYALNGGGGGYQHQQELMSEPAGGHTPTGKAKLGVGAPTEGTAFFNPYYGKYIWVRTA